MSLIKIDSLYKKYLTGEEENYVLNNLSLTIEPGQFIGLHGRSGSGKTTLLQIIGCIDNFNKGKYFFENQEVNALSDSELTLLRRQKIGFIFQNFNLIPTMTVAENVAYPLTLLKMTPLEIENRIDEILEPVGLKDFKHRFPPQLSGGQRQRVSIARALVKKPSLVIADEPTANLDEENSNKIAEVLVNMQRQMKVTIVCSSHDSYFLEHSDLKFRIHQGQASLS